MSNELDSIEVRIEPQYCYPGRKQLNVTVKYKGKEYHNVEELHNSDAMSVLDYCFERTRRIINDMIKEETRP